MDRDIEEGPTPLSAVRQVSLPLVLAGAPVTYGPSGDTEASEAAPRPCPFWSERALAEHQLQLSRPADLDRQADGQATERDAVAGLALAPGQQGTACLQMTAIGIQYEMEPGELGQSEPVSPQGARRLPLEDGLEGSRVLDNQAGRNEQTEDYRRILERMSDLLSVLVSQGDAHSTRLERLEEELAMRSAASGRTVLEAQVQPDYGARPEDSGVSKPLLASSGHGVVHSNARITAEDPTAKHSLGPTRSGCQYFYIGDAPGKNQPQGPAGSVTQPTLQGEDPKNAQASMLKAMLLLGEDDVRVARHHIAENMLSGPEVTSYLQDFLASRGFRPFQGSSGGAVIGSSVAPKPEGGGVRGAQAVTPVAHASGGSQAMLSASLLQTQTGSGPQAGNAGFVQRNQVQGPAHQADGDVGHLGGIAHLHSGSVGSIPGVSALCRGLASDLHGHPGLLSGVMGSQFPPVPAPPNLHSGSAGSKGGYGAQALDESWAGSLGAKGPIVSGQGCFSNAGLEGLGGQKLQGGGNAVQVQSNMSAVHATNDANVHPSLSPFDPLPRGHLGVWNQEQHGCYPPPPSPCLQTGSRPLAFDSAGMGAAPTPLGVGRWEGGADEGIGRRSLYTPGEKTFWDLPKLPELDQAKAPLQAGDWIATISPMMADLAPSSGEYWQAVLAEAGRFYATWQTADPLTRSQVIAVPPPYLTHPSLARLENRALAMLLKAVPETLREELISSRNMSTINLIFKVYCVYQPGGLRERSMLLTFLTSPGQASTAVEAVAALRKWFRWMDRTVQMGATLPDVSLLVQGLDALTSSVLGSMPHVQFRMNMVRTRCALDHNPTVVMLQTYARSLQAEMESAAVGTVPDASHTSKRQRLQALNAGEKGGKGGNAGHTTAETPKGPDVPKVGVPVDATAGSKAAGKGGKGPGQQAQGGGSNGGGGSSNASSPLNPAQAGNTKTCFYFLKQNGCKLGNTCHFKHDHTQFGDPSVRCSICGSAKHKKSECEAPGGPRCVKGSEVPKTPHQASASQGSHPNAKAPSPNATSSTSAGAPAAKAAALKPEEVLANAAAMLQGLKLSGVNLAGGQRIAAIRVSSASSSTDAFGSPTPHTQRTAQYGLLDGGATNPLRTAEPLEIADASPVEVSLATGDGVRLWMTRTGTLLSDMSVDPIVPMGCLTHELGCNVTWEGSSCRVWHPERGWLEVTMIDQCPYVTNSVALALIRELELRRAVSLVQAARLRLLSDRRQLDVTEAWTSMKKSAREVIVEGREDDWLRDLDSSFFGVMASLFSDAPEDQVLEAIGTPCFWVAGEETPWNRRLRRSMERSQGVLIHLCSGLQDWVHRPRSDYRVLSVDVANGHDLLSNGVWSYLTRLAKLGLIRGVVGGLPKPSDSRGRYAVLTMRVLGLCVLAQAAHGDTFVAITAPGNSLISTEGSAHDREEPSDPETFGYDSSPFPEWPIKDKLSQVVGLRTAECDQGFFGATESVPVQVHTTSWDLYVLLHRRVLLNRHVDRWAPELVMAVLKAWDIWITDTAEERRRRACEQSVYVAEASQGAHDCLLEVRQCLVEDRGEFPAEVIPRLRPLPRGPGHFRPPATRLPLQRLARIRLSHDEVEYKKHVERGHFPYRSDCRECLRGAGKRRPHRSRGPTVDSYSLAADLGGPYVAALSELSPLKSMPKPRYLFVACYTFPVDEQTQELVWESGTPSKASAVQGAADSSQLEPSDGAIQPNGQAPEVSVDAAIPEDCLDYEPSDVSEEVLDPESGRPGRMPLHVTDDEGVADHGQPKQPQAKHEPVLEYDPESGRPGRMPLDVTDDEGMPECADAGFLDMQAGDAIPKVCQACLHEADANTRYWKRSYATRVDGVCVRRLVFVETLPKRTKEEVSAALARTLTKLQQWHFPVLRLHTDRGGEWMNRMVRDVADRYELVHTCTEGHDPSSNGRAESVVGLIKAAIRSRLSTPPGFSPRYWSLAALDAGQGLLRAELAKFDKSVRPLIPWATQVCVREKKNEENHWSSRFVNGYIVGPSSHTPRGYTIALEPLDEPKLLVSTTIRLNRPFHALPITLPGEIWHVDPERRVRGKQSLLPTQDEDAALDDLAVVGGEVARLSEAAPDHMHEAPFVAALSLRRVRRQGERLSLEQSEQISQSLLAQPELDKSVAASAVYVSLCGVSAKVNREIDSNMLQNEEAWACTFGAYCHGPHVGIIMASRKRPMFVRMINRLVSTYDVAHEYTALRITYNAESALHKDSHNQRGFCNLIIRLSEFSGGRIFTPDGPLEFDAEGRVYLDPSGLHGIEASDGPRLVVIAYTPGFAAKLSVLDIHTLLSLGFNVPNAYRPDLFPKNPSIQTLTAGVQDGLPSPACQDGAQSSLAERQSAPESGRVKLPVSNVPNREHLDAHSTSDFKAPGFEAPNRARSVPAFEGPSVPADAPTEALDQPVLDLERPCAAVVPGHELGEDCTRYTVQGIQTTSRGPDETSGGSAAGFSGMTTPFQADDQYDMLDYFCGHAATASSAFRCDGQSQHVSSLLGWMSQYEDMREASTSTMVKAVRLRSLAEAIDPSLDATTRALMQVQVESALEEIGTTEMPLRGEPSPDILLQTQQVSLAEVRQDLEAWKGAIAEELSALITVHQAVRVITKLELQELEASGVTVQTVPGKLVFSVKAPDKRKRARLVACGNFLPDSQQSQTGLLNPSSSGTSGPSSAAAKAENRRDVYASGLETESLRLQLRWAAGHMWDGVVIDVKTAFLLAPARRRNGSKVAVVVPRLIIDANLLDRDTFLLVDRALYGLVESPSDWSTFRDRTLEQWSWTGPNDRLRKLRQAEADPSLWFVLEALEGESGVIEFCNEWGAILAVLGVYVDDLLITGPTIELCCMVTAFGGLWKTSTPNWLKDGLRFCGIEVELGLDGSLHLHQTSYLSDLVARYNLPSETTLPDFKAGYEEVETLTIPALRQAQRIVGELLWLSGKTRMDISFTVSKLGQYCSKHPRAVYRDGLRTLAYLARTSQLKLRYGRFDEPWTGQEPLRFTRSQLTVEGWSDASFGQDDGSRSQSGIMLIVAGGVVSWHSSRQTLTALSTAESEIIAAVDSMVLARAIAPLWAELCRSDLLWSQCVDNSACVQLLLVPGGAWRTRHLRLRARHFQEAIAEESLAIQHMPGTEMLSDSLTKSLPESRLFFLLELSGYVWGPSSAWLNVSAHDSDSHVNHVVGQSSHDEVPEFSSAALRELARSGDAADPQKAARTLACLLLLAAVPGAVGEVTQGHDGGEQTWEFSVFECLLFCGVLFAWEVCRYVFVVCVKGRSDASNCCCQRRRVVRNSASSLGSESAAASPELTVGNHSDGQTLREQERLYGRRQWGPSFGLVEGWMQVGVQDRWRWDEASCVLIRFHATYRTQLFHAPNQIAAEFPMLRLTGRRKTWFQFEGQDPDYILDDISQGARRLSQSWQGRTEFAVMRR